MSNSHETNQSPSQHLSSDVLNLADSMKSSSLDLYQLLRKRVRWSLISLAVFVPLSIVFFSQSLSVLNHNIIIPALERVGLSPMISSSIVFVVFFILSALFVFYTLNSMGIIDSGQEERELEEKIEKLMVNFREGKEIVLEAKDQWPQEIKEAISPVSMIRRNPVTALLVSAFITGLLTIKKTEGGSYVSSAKHG